MARLRVLQAEEIEHPALRGMMADSGDEMFGVYAHSAENFHAFLQFYRPVKYEGRLPFALKELVRLRIAELNACTR